jgi:hypothetical protein
VPVSNDSEEIERLQYQNKLLLKRLHALQLVLQSRIRLETNITNVLVDLQALSGDSGPVESLAKRWAEIQRESKRAVAESLTDLSEDCNESRYS